MAVLSTRSRNLPRSLDSGRFHIVPYRQFISGQAELFVAKAGKDPGRAAAVAVYQQLPLYQSRWPMAILSKLKDKDYQH